MSVGTKRKSKFPPIPTRDRDEYVTFTQTPLQKFAAESRHQRKELLLWVQRKGTGEPDLRMHVANLLNSAGPSVVADEVDGGRRARTLGDGSTVVDGVRYARTRLEWQDELKENTTTMQDAYIGREEFAAGFIEL